MPEQITISPAMRALFVCFLATNILFCLGIGFFSVFKSAEQSSFGAGTISGLIGRYQTVPATVDDGTGSAIITDSQGRAIISTTTVISITLQ